MSLINEALKRAQQERQQSEQARMPNPGGPSSNYPSAIPANGSGWNALKLAFGLVIAGSVLASALAFMFFLWIQVGKQPADPMADLASAPLVRAIPTSDPAPVASEETMTVSDPTPTPLRSSAAPDPVPAPVSSAADAVVDLPVARRVAEPSPSPAPDRAAAPRSNPEVEEYVRQARVTGIRMAGADSKVVLNNRVYRLNGLVLDFAAPLRIVTIQSNTIEFVDEHGFRYTKRF